MCWLVCYWLYGTDGMDGELVGQGWDVGTGVSRRRNGIATIVVVTGVPPLALEGRRVVGSGVWHQLCQCCKGAEYYF